MFLYLGSIMKYNPLYSGKNNQVVFKMVKRTARKAASSSAANGTCACVCNKDGHAKMAAGFKILMALAILGFAAGMLPINLSAWVVGLLVLIKGLMMLKGQ